MEEKKKVSFKDFNKYLIQEIKLENDEIMYNYHFVYDFEDEKFENYNNRKVLMTDMFFMNNLYGIMAKYKGEYNEKYWGLKSDFYKKLYVDLHNLKIDYNRNIKFCLENLKDDKFDEEQKDKMKKDIYCSKIKLFFIVKLLNEIDCKIATMGILSARKKNNNI
jgi:hypothetical protein